jgi:hypothetical protein
MLHYMFSLCYYILYLNQSDLGMFPHNLQLSNIIYRKMQVNYMNIIIFFFIVLQYNKLEIKCSLFCLYSSCVLCLCVPKCIINVNSYTGIRSQFIALNHVNVRLMLIRVSDCCLAPTQQLFSYIMPRTSKLSVR